MAQIQAKENPNIENIRQYKILRNTANNIIAKERYSRKKKDFEDQKMNKQKWKKAKDETGQTKLSCPTTILDGQKIITKPREIATVLNRQFLTTIRETIKKIPKTELDPIKMFSHYIGRVDSKLNLQEISMHQMTNIIKSMHSTTSSAADFVSVRILKQAGEVINPLLLHLVNSVVKTEVYPDSLKLMKIVPVRKPAKPQEISTGWRPINIVPSVSKIIEKCLLIQLTEYLEKNKFINYTHHGSVKG